MSDIKIQPSGSGTAVVTLTAPTTNTARTITFPDATGTLLNSGSTLDATKLSGALPALSATNLTAIPAANITGTHANFLSTGVDDNATAVKLTVTDSGININGDITFSSASQGICLGVTSNTDANTLDDYEEGTWTGTITVGGSDNLEGTYDSTYTKIGRQVIVHYAAQLTNTTNGTGHLWVSGLPFTKTGGDGDSVMGCNDRMNATSAVFRVADGQSIAKAYKLPTSTSTNLTNFDNADMGNTGKWLYFCLTYYV